MEALRAGDTDAARNHQRAAARAAVREGDGEAFETAAELTGALRQHDQCDAGVESKRRYERTIERLERRLRAADAAAGDDEGGNSRRTGTVAEDPARAARPFALAQGRLDKLAGPLAEINPQTIARSKLVGYRDRLNEIRGHVGAGEALGEPESH